MHEFGWVAAPGTAVGCPPLTGVAAGDSVTVVSAVAVGRNGRNLRPAPAVLCRTPQLQSAGEPQE